MLVFVCLCLEFSEAPVRVTLDLVLLSLGLSVTAFGLVLLSLWISATVTWFLVGHPYVGTDCQIAGPVAGSCEAIR